jgi:lipopolysaccharide export system protein LptA
VFSVIRCLAIALALSLPVAAGAQTNIALGGISADPNAPVEVTADSLTVDQDTGSAIFTGNVLIGQGDLRISAAEVQVFYDDVSGQIARFVAAGGVTLVTATEAAEAQDADYDLTLGTLVMTGDVLLTQGTNALSAERMTLNLRQGTAVMDGRVRTVFRPAPEGN